MLYTLRLVRARTRQQSSAIAAAANALGLTTEGLASLQTESGEQITTESDV